MTMQTLISGFVTLLAAILSVAPAHATDRMPNILLIVADDSHWGDMQGLQPTEPNVTYTHNGQQRSTR
jgi:hypothetical protein